MCKYSFKTQQGSHESRTWPLTYTICFRTVNLYRYVQKLCIDVYSYLITAYDESFCCFILRLITPLLIFGFFFGSSTSPRQVEDGRRSLYAPYFNTQIAINTSLYFFWYNIWHYLTKLFPVNVSAVSGSKINFWNENFNLCRSHVACFN